MKKDKEWLKEQIKDEEVELKYAFDNYVPYEKVLIADDVNELLNQLEEPEQEKVVVTENMFWEYMSEQYYFDKESFFEKLKEYNYLKKHSIVEKPVIPQFVADFITEIKPNFNIRTVFTLKNNKHEQGQEWALDNPDVFARAWLDGYTVEEQKLYQIKLPITTWNRDASTLEERTMFLAFNTTSDETTTVNSPRKNGDYRTDLTEVQIKAIDERYWAFAEEVTK